MIPLSTRLALRRLARERGVVLLLITGLSCGLAVLTLAASFAWTVLVQPFPFPQPDRIVRVFETVRGNSDDLVSTSAPVYEALDRASLLESLAFLRPFESAVLTTEAGALQLGVSFVGGRYFDLIGAIPSLGRLPMPEELDGRADPNVVLISHELWEREFGAEPGAVGSTVDIAGASHEIVGVAAPGQLDLSSAFVDVDAWLPVGSSARPYPADFRIRPDARFFHIYGRTPPEVGLEAINAELEAESREFARIAGASHEDAGFLAMPLRERFMGDTGEPAILIMAGAAFLLLVAWINALSLAASRSARVAPQMWIQLAVGGTRRDTLRVGAIEYGIVLLLTGLCTALLTNLGMALLERTAPLILPAFMTIELPPGWLAVAVLLPGAILLSLVAGPIATTVRRLSREDGDARGARRAATLGLGVQVGVATWLALGAVVLGLSLRHLGALDRGFDPEGVAFFQTDLGVEAYPATEDVWGVARAIEERLSGAVPEVTAASVWSPAIPGWSGNRTGIVVEGAIVETQAESVISRYHSIGPGALDLLGIEVIRGRGIEPWDRAGSNAVVVVSETAAELLWPGLDPLGRRLRRFSAGEPGEPEWYEVVGVAADALHSGRISGTGTEADVYFAYLQVSRRTRALTVLLHHGEGGPPPPVSVQNALHEIGLSMPRPRIEPLIETVDAEMGVHRAAAASITILAASALFLALLGIYGVMSTRAQRARRDIGIRRALGASDWSVVEATGRSVAGPVACGVGVGVAGALILDALIGSLIVGTPPTDPLLLSLLAAGVGALAVLAALPPLLRAVRASPVAALRDGG